MRALHAPVYDANAYQELLFDALADHGVEIATERRAIPFTLFSHRLRDTDVLHLHWLHPYFLFGSFEWLYRVPFSRLICWAAALVFIAQVAIAERQTRIVWTAHNLINHERRYERLDRWVTAQVIARADAVQVWDDCTTSELRQQFDIGSTEVIAIPHGHYRARYEREDRTVGREHLGLPADTRVYLFFGTIRPYKGVPDLIQAFEKIDGLLVVAGNSKCDALETELRSLVEGRKDVRLDLGYVPDETVSMYLGAADVTVFPYRDIYNSGSVVLAMSLGCPVVAPAKGSIPSVLPEGNVVYDDLQSGLYEVSTKSDDELQRVGKRNAEVAQEEHDWNDVARKMKTLYSGRSGQSI